MGAYYERKKKGFARLPQGMQAYVAPIEGKGVVPAHDNQANFRRKPVDEWNGERVRDIRPYHEGINGQIKPS